MRRQITIDINAALSGRINMCVRVAKTCTHMRIKALRKLQIPAMRIFIADVDIHICHRMIADAILGMAPVVVRCNIQSLAKIMRNTDLPRVAGLRLKVRIAIYRCIELIRRRGQEILGISYIGMRPRCNIIAKAHTRTRMTAESRITVVADAADELECRRDVPLILQIDGTIHEGSPVNAHSSSVPNRRIIIRKIHASCQEMIAETLIILVTELPAVDVHLVA